MPVSSTRPVTAILVGAGHRAAVYASYALSHPEELQIVGVADPLEVRRRPIAEQYGLRPDQCFRDAAELAAKGKRADAIINGTMDADHVATTLPLLDAGYDVLLEKPFAVSEAEVIELARAVRRTQRKVMICHVLRYAPFYVEVQKRIASGELGKIVNLQATEHVSYHHMATAFVRGKWGNRDACGSPIILSKCCHDMDLLTWLKSGVPPVRVASFGGLGFFRPENAPEGAGTRCLVDCPIEARCAYSAKRHFVDMGLWKFYAWSNLEDIENPTVEQKLADLRRLDNPMGRCVWKCDNTVCDRQTLSVDFADGATASFDLVGGVSRPMRKIHVIGTQGELMGIFDEGKFSVFKIQAEPGQEYSVEVVDTNLSGDFSGAASDHGGGDMRLTADFVRLVRNQPTSPSCTHLEDSIAGHLLAFLADRARIEGVVLPVTLPEI